MVLIGSYGRQVSPVRTTDVFLHGSKFNLSLSNSIAVIEKRYIPTVDSKWYLLDAQSVVEKTLPPSAVNNKITKKSSCVTLLPSRQKSLLPGLPAMTTLWRSMSLLHLNY